MVFKVPSNPNNSMILKLINGWKRFSKPYMLNYKISGILMGRILLVPTLYQRLCAAVLTTYADLAEIV